MADFNLYAALNVARRASLTEIKHAYRHLASAYSLEKKHDDRKATKNLQEINLAYEILSDPIKRDEYDERHPRLAEGTKGRPALATVHDLAFEQRFRAPCKEPCKAFYASLKPRFKEHFKGTRPARSKARYPVCQQSRYIERLKTKLNTRCAVFVKVKSNALRREEFGLVPQSTGCVKVCPDCGSKFGLGFDEACYCDIDE
ncbi:hypothetical protein DSL72_004722 [Monilinia vaccinii-corymbosi]|uniref:J domain-containing protein n=1 Tax=Monilinia vaccinii-corymbosi TaxID=61207 RepID=A0A8A3NZZ9_9HELO|nr:hypothetical protein DSL72_004722 [Monilinia vaccinii-corymbosi]